MIGCVDGDETYGPTVAIVGGMRLRKKCGSSASLSALVKDHNQLASFHASRGKRAAMTKAVDTSTTSPASIRSTFA